MWGSYGAMVVVRICTDHKHRGCALLGLWADYGVVEVRHTVGARGAQISCACQYRGGRSGRDQAYVWAWCDDQPEVDRTLSPDWSPSRRSPARERRVDPL